MPFGLTNAPSTFQGLMNEVFRPYLRKFVLVFFDDILVYSKNLKEHLKHVRLVLEALKVHHLYAKASKCTFESLEMDYLGHVISEEGVKADPTKIGAMKSWPNPRTPKALRGFLGLTGYYRKFAKGYGGVAAPLTALLKKNSFVWSEKAEAAFRHLKELMSTPPVLGLPDFTKKFIIECDASGAGIGAVLMQNGRPLAYLSQALKGKSLFLSNYEKELLSLVMAVQKWRHYLLGQSFVVRTDQQALKYLWEQRVGTPAQQKWVSKLLGYDFMVEYKRGRENKAGDALSGVSNNDTNGEEDARTAEETSRKAKAGEETNIGQASTPIDSNADLTDQSYTVQELELQAISTIRADWLEELKKSYPSDTILQQLLQQLQKEALDPAKYSMQIGILFYKGRLHLGTLLPVQQQILQQFHSSPLASHLGKQKTYSKVKKEFYWPKMKMDIRKYIRECNVC